jgi:hypothetical protein
MKTFLMLSNEFVPLVNAATSENSALCHIPLPYDTFDGSCQGVSAVGTYCYILLYM